MKKNIILSILLFQFTSLVAAAEPKCTQDSTWKYVVNNAYRVADQYATNNNPQSTFFSLKNNYSFVEQVAGKYKGKYLLLLTNKHGRNTSFAALIPLFNVNKSSSKLNDKKPLWKVVNAKLNGRPY